MTVPENQSLAESSSPETWTIQKLLDWSTQYLGKHGIVWPHLEAEILIAQLLGIKRIQLYLQGERIISPEELSRYKGWILRRKNHEPLAYVTGNQPFLGLDFKITPAVLIPRPETEKMAELIIAEINALPPPENGARPLLEIGTGSGCLAVSLARFCPGLAVTAIEKSTAALEIAKANAQSNGVSNAINFILTEAQHFELSGENAGRFDYLVSNPPYIPSAEIDQLDPSVKNYEPRAALDGGTDGLDFVRIIAKKAKTWLNSGGRLWLEIGMGQKETAEGILKIAGFNTIKTLADQNKLDRYLTANR